MRYCRSSWIFKESSLLIKCVSETFKNKVQKQKGGLFGVLFGTLGAGL